jgi:hypothetical protein
VAREQVGATTKLWNDDQGRGLVALPKRDEAGARTFKTPQGEQQRIACAAPSKPTEAKAGVLIPLTYCPGGHCPL